MKKLSLVLAMAITLLAITASAGDKKEEQYEVTISIVYNAVSSDEAMRLAKVAHSQFKDTCKHNVSIKKLETSGWVTLNVDSWTSTTSGPTPAATGRIGSSK